MSELKFLPLGDRIQIRPDDAMSKTAGGMIIPDTAKEKTVTGVVMAVGPKVIGVVKVGDRVVYSPFSIFETNVDGKPLVYVRESDCHFVITEENKKYEQIIEVIEDVGTFENQLKIQSDTPLNEGDQIYDPATMQRGMVVKSDSHGTPPNIFHLFIESVDNSSWNIPKAGKCYGVIASPFEEPERTDVTNKEPDHITLTK